MGIPGDFRGVPGGRRGAAGGGAGGARGGPGGPGARGTTKKYIFRCNFDTKFPEGILGVRRGVEQTVISGQVFSRRVKKGQKSEKLPFSASPGVQNFPFFFRDFWPFLGPPDPPGTPPDPPKTPFLGLFGPFWGLFRGFPP